MGETTEYPMVLDIIATHEQGFVFRDGFYMGKLAKELGALLAERDALAAKWEDAERRLDDEKALRFEATRPAARRLREVHVPPVNPNGKACAYRYANGQIEYRPLTGNHGWGKAQSLPVSHAAEILALESSPEEPVETLEKAVDSAADRWLTGFGICISTYQRVQLGVLMVESIRTWLAQQPAPEMTAAQHIKALRKIGAQWYPRVTSLRTPYEGAVISWWPLTGGALVLPEELAPTAEDVFGKDWDK